MSDRPRSLEVCAGIGGLTLGLEMAGWECAGLVEIDDRCRAHLREKWPDVPVLADMRALTDDDLRRVGPVDLLAGGIPCQPWSVAGKQGGSDDERDLWPDFLALAGRLGAAALLVENVPGLASDPRGLDRIAGDIERAGYCWWAASIRAADVGAPHLRDRLFICALADRDGAGCRELGSGRASTGIALGDDPNGCGDPRHPYCRRGSCCHNPNACDGNDCWLARYPERMPVDPDEDDDEFLADVSRFRRREGRPEPEGQQGRPDAAEREPIGRLADTGGSGSQGRRRPAAGLQRPAAERGRPVGDAADGGCRGSATAEVEGGREGSGQPGRQQGRQLAGGPQGRGPWSDARPILCRDGKWRLVPFDAAELALLGVADGPAEELASRFPVGPAEPGRVARLRALGNAVCPLQAYVAARALLEVMTGIPTGGAAA